jgi:hypothetical protein
MADDGFDIDDLETSVLSGRIAKVERDDPRGTRYTVHGLAVDGAKLVGSAGRFTETGRHLIITAFEVTEG